MTDPSGQLTPSPSHADTGGQGPSGPGAGLLDRLRDLVDRQSPVLAERVSLQAQRARERAAELRVQGRPGPARLTEQAADRAQQAGDWLRQVDADRLAQSANRLVSDLKARRPGASRRG